MADDERRKEIAAAVQQLLKPEEAWIIRKQDTSVEVVEEGRSSLSATDPELYGRLLQVSEQLSGSGGSLCIWGPICVIAVCLAIHMQWLDSALGPAADSLKSFWVYGFATVTSIFLFGGLAKYWERIVYGRYRNALMRAIEDAKLTPHRLIAQIEGDESLENLADQLKNDPEIV